MERREFLETLGLGAAFVLTTACLGGCSKTSTNPVDITLDLTQSANSALSSNGGYVINSGVVIARDTSGNYVAATQTCSHEGLNQVYYDKSSNSYRCTAHGAQYNLSGTGLNSNGSGGLTIYSVTKSGNTLHITG